IKLINNGPAVEDVDVQLTNSSGQIVQTDLTSANGEYEFTNVPRGSYTITPVKTDWIFDPVNISIPMLTRDLIQQNFTAKYTRNVVSGYISDDRGNPVVGMSVKLWAFSVIFQEITTGSDGCYEFRDVVSGGYIVTPSAFGWVVDPLNRCVNVMAENIENVDFRAVNVLYPEEISGTFEHGLYPEVMSGTIQ
ncbi:MAG: SdrD B-like domain-containing protein, partial [Bacteroidota bacterium]